MRAGTLRHRVQFQSIIQTPDGIGGADVSWGDVATVFADVRYLNGLETVKSDAPIDVKTCSIRIRWRSDITPGMRAKQGEVVFDIKSVLPDPTGRRHLDLVCETGQNQG